jgi:transglutaminase-like putative cysteine protease
MKITMPVGFAGYLFMALLGAAPAVRAGDTNYSGSDWAFTDPQTVQAAAAEITPAKYPDCDTVTVEGRQVRAFYADGTGECQDEFFTKALTEKGRRASRELSFSFTLPYTTTEVVKLEVVKPDGTVVPVDAAANSKVSIDEGQMEMNIYDPNDKVLRVNLPQLEIGDLVHVVSRQVIHRSVVPQEYDELNLFEGASHIRHLTYEIHAPAALPLQRTALRDEIPGTVTATTQTNGDTVVYHWEVNQVPRMFDEPDMPPYEMVLQRLLVSTVPDWRDLSKWYWSLSRPHLDMTTPDMTNTVAGLTAGAKTDLDKVRAIFYYVSKNIRYMGITPESDRPGYEPHDVCLTFNKKYGVCRDKAGLLVEMLRLAGFKAYPVLINIGARLDAVVPGPDFNHAIACVELTPGEYTLMDPTDENTRDLLPAYDGNRSYLVCRPEGEGLRLSPVQPPELHQLQVTTTGTLEADGVLKATSQLSFTGVNDDAYRNRLVEMKPDEQKRFFEERLKSAIPGARLTALKVTPENLLDASVPLHAELSFTASGLTAGGDGKSVVSLPWVAKDLGVANRILTTGTGLASRRYPLQIEVACGVHEDVSLKLAGGFAGALALPEFQPVNDASLAYTVTAAVTNHTLHCTRHFDLKTVEFSPAQYLQLRQTLKTMDFDRRKNLILALKSKVKAKSLPATRAAVPPVASNAEILRSRKSLAVQDAHTAVYHVSYAKRILTYDGKIREAEVKIPYNPACEEAKLVRATVIGKDGARQEISPGEINVMDEGWNATAKRYPGGKVLVASLPGVDLGSIIEVEFEIKMHDLPFVAGFEPFQFPDALAEKSFALTAPADLPMQRLVSGAAGAVQELDTTSNRVQTLNWQARRVPAQPSEQELPPEWNYLPGVSYFAGDAAAYWQALNGAMLERSGHSAKAAALARQLAGAAPSKLEAVRAIRDFVAKNIRVAGPSFTELPLRELSDADTTLADGYGHAADRAILYHAMLAAAGFQAELVMASALPPVAGITNVAQAFPLPSNFEIPLVRVAVDGADYYLNDTDQYAQLGTTEADGKLGLALASRKLETVRAAAGCGDRTETDYALALADDGRARLKISKHFYGRDFNAKKRFFAELPPEERKHYFQEVVSHVAQGARPAGGLTTAFDAYPGREEFSVDLDDYGIVDGKYLSFNLPFTPSLIAAGTDQRALPLFLADGRERVVRAEIELPAGFRPTEVAPPSASYTAPGGSRAEIAVTNAPGKVVVTDRLATVPGIIAPGDYPALLDIQTALSRKPATVFLLERK